METSVNEISELKKELLVKIPGDEVNTRHAEIINIMASRLNIKGFRKGKVPKDIARRYVKTSAEEQLLLDLLKDSMEDAMKEAGVEMSDFRRIGFYIKPINEDGSFEYRIQVQLYPEVDPEKYLGIAVSIEEPAEITPEDLDARMEDLRKEALEPQEKDGVIEIGDLVNLTYSRYEDGKDEPLLENFSTALRVEEDKDLLIKGFKDALLGLKKEDTFDVTGQGTVGKDVKTYRLTGKVDKVSALVAPDLDDELARKFGAENLDDLKEKVRKAMDEERDARRKALIEEEVRKQLADLIPMEDDRTIMEETFAEMDADTFQDNEFFEDPENLARMAKMIREEAIFMAIATKENIEVTEEDIEQEMQTIAAMSGQPLPYVRAQNRSKIEDGSLPAQVKQKKVMDLLVRYAKVNEEVKKKAEPKAKKAKDDTDKAETKSERTVADPNKEGDQ